MKSLRTYLTGSIVIALATLLQSGVIADDANWTGGGDGSTYSQIANWDTLDVPINNGTTYDVMIGGTPSVLFDAGVGSNTVDSLSLAQGATFTVNPGLTLNVLGVSNVGGRINVNNSTFSAPSATSMFSGRPYLFADNGGNINIAAASWAATYSDSQTIMRADNATISLATLGSLTANDNTSYTDTLTVHAANNGMIDLSKMVSTSSNDILRFLIESGGNILFTNLTTTNKVQFDIHVPALALPALNTANSTQFIARSGNAITANAMTDQAGGSVTLETNATFNATALQQMRNTTLSAENGATFNAPALTDVAGSTLNLDPGFTFTSGVLNNIDNSRFFVSGGMAFSGVSATAMTGTYSNSQTVIQAEGAGSSINLSSLTSLSLNDNTSYTDTLTVRAGAGGKVDLSGVDTVSTNDKILFHVQSQSEIDLSSLQAVGGGQYEFRVEAEGTLKLGDFTVTNNSAFNINDATSVVNIGGSLLLDNPSTFNVATGGGVSVAGNFSFATTSETAFQSDDGILTMNGSGTFASPQWLEVGGQDLGLPTSPLDVLGDDGNFAIGQLVVGQDGQFTVVQLADAIDNGNRSSFEALYLPGLGGDGLEIFGGSVLNIESINVYAFLDGNWTHLNSLFTGGITEIELSSLVSDPEANGTIIVPEPATPALLALGLITAGLFGRRWKQQSPRSRQAEPRLHGL